MASVAIIEEDEKIRRELVLFVKELSIDDVYEFSSSHEFEKKFFFSLVKKTPPAENPKNILSELHPDVVKFLTAAKFSPEPGAEEESSEITISADKTQILKVSVAKIFGKAVTELILKNVTLESLIPSECQPQFKTLINELKVEKNTTRKILPIKNEKNEIYVIEISGHPQKENIILKATNKTHTIAKLLGKETEKKEEEKKEEPLKPLDLIIFRANCIKEADFKHWVSKAATLLKKANLWPLESRPKFIAIRYEDDAKEKADYNHPFIDDLICMPFDRLIFLQKIEIAVGLPKKTSPSILFVQQASDSIEISKKIHLTRVNDLGVAMPNPVPLTPGTLVHVYFRFPGQKPLLDVYAKALTSIASPSNENEHLVYFDYFGLNKNMNKEIRSYLLRDTGFHNLVDSDARNFKFNKENIFFTDEQKIKKTIAILDIDEQVLKNISDYSKNEIANTDIITSDSYYAFFKKYLTQSGDEQKAPAAQTTDFYAESVSILIGAFDLKLQMPLTPPSEEDRFLDYEIQKVFADPAGWLQLFDGDAKDLLTECLHLIRETRRVSKNFELKNATGELRTVAVELIAEDNGDNVRINFTPPEKRAHAHKNQIEKLDSLECVLIDYALLPDDIEAFLIGLQEGLKRANIRTYPNGPKLIVMATEKQRVDLDRLLHGRVSGFIYKPLEIRRILYMITQAINTPFSLYSFENIGWKQDNIPAKIARDATMVELSEFGCTIKTTQPLKAGTMLYLFKSIFNNAPDQNLCVRVYHSEENDAEEGTYLNYVIYFGITDAFLKYTRSYIRETYAQKKSKEG